MSPKFCKTETGLHYYTAAGTGVGAYARDDDDARTLIFELFRSDQHDACLKEWARLGYRVRLAQ